MSYSNPKDQTAYNREYARKRRLTAEGRLQNKLSAQKWRKKNFKTVMLQTIRSRAKKEGTKFSITADDLKWPTHCPVFGVELIYGGGFGLHRNSASIDRKDNSKGYIPGNVNVLSWRANCIKNDASAAELRAVADWVDKY